MCCAWDLYVRSRYVSGHMLRHAETIGKSGASPTDSSTAGAGASGGNEAAAVAISLADLSCWCFACDSYVADPAIEPVLQVFRAAKFGGGSGVRDFS